MVVGFEVIWGGGNIRAQRCAPMYRQAEDVWWRGEEVKRWKPETGLTLNAVRHGFVITSNCGKYKNRVLYNAWMVPQLLGATTTVLKPLTILSASMRRRSVAAGNLKLFKLTTFQHFSNCLFARYNIRLMDSFAASNGPIDVQPAALIMLMAIRGTLWSSDYCQRTLF